MQKGDFLLTTEFKTTDFYLVAYLLLEGMRISRVDSRIEGRSVFYLVDQPNRDELVKRYLYGEARVDPIRYKECIQRLKSFKHNTGD